MFLRSDKYAACALALALAACSSPPPVGGSSRINGPKQATGPTTGAAAGSGLPSATSAGPQDSHVLLTSKPSLQGTAGAGLKEGQCAKQNIVTSRVTPTIWLVLDGSGSMVNPLDGAPDMKSRWAALHEALMDPDLGVVKALEHDVKWGLVLYDGPGGAGGQPLPDGGFKMFEAPPADTCPRVIVSEPKKDAYMDLSAIVKDEPLGGSTPTDKALNVVVSHLDDMTGQVLDARINPTIVVLATDGEPNDFCGNGMQGGGLFGGFGGADVRPQVVAAVKQLASMDVKTYVVSLAGADMNLTAHLNDVAAAGGTGKQPFIPMSKDQLVQAFKDIIGPPTACDVVLNGSVKPGIECMGTIKVNGMPLTCDDANGWMLKNPSTVSITGTACEQYKADLSAVLEADFPCEAIDLN
jgi:hypothetical protein